MQANQLSVHTEENLVMLYNLPDPGFKLDRCNELPDGLYELPPVHRLYPRQRPRNDPDERA